MFSTSNNYLAATLIRQKVVTKNRTLKLNFLYLHVHDVQAPKHEY